MIAGGGQALGSPGCDAVNAGGFNFSVSIGGTARTAASSRTVGNLAVGDVVTFTIDSPAAVADSTWTLRSGNATALSSLGPQAGLFRETRSYTVSGNQQDNQLTATIQRNGPLAPLTIPTSSTTQAATCTPAPAANTDSNKLRTLQIGVTKLVGESSGAAIANATGQAINSAFNGGNPIIVNSTGITFNFAAEPLSEVERRADRAYVVSGYAGNLVKALPLESSTQVWSVWADVRGTAWERDSIDLRGYQLNATAGVGYRLSPSLVVGIFGGYEHFKYNVASLTGTIKGDGGTFGGYAGWQITTHVRWDATLAWSRIFYDGVAGAASGSFNGSRLLTSTGLTGTYRWAPVILEPSVRIHGLWEGENAFVDTLGTTQAARNFALARAETGGRVILPGYQASGLGHPMSASTETTGS